MWLFLSLLVALSEGIRATLSKYVLRECDEFVVTWTQRLFVVPVGLALIVIADIQSVTTMFFVYCVIGIFVLMLSSTLYMRSIKISPLYLTMPYLALTPLFMLVTSLLMVGEFPSKGGIAGIVLIAAGVYLLHLDRRHTKWWEPITAIKKEKGSLFMLAVAFLFSIGANLDKLAMREASPMIYVGFMTILFSIFYAPVVLFRSDDAAGQIGKHWKMLILLAVVQVIVIMLQMIAMNVALVTYVISIKRLSVLVAVVLGYFIYREKGLGYHLVAAALMVAGASFIALQ